MEETIHKIDKYISREVQVILGVVSILGIFYSMVLLPMQEQKSEIQALNSNYEYIKNNDLRHIEDNTKALEERMNDNDKEHMKIEQQLTRLITLQEASNKGHGIPDPADQ